MKKLLEIFETIKKWLEILKGYAWLGVVILLIVLALSYFSGAIRAKKYQKLEVENAGLKVKISQHLTNARALNKEVEFLKETADDAQARARELMKEKEEIEKRNVKLEAEKSKMARDIKKMEADEIVKETRIELRAKEEELFKIGQGIIFTLGIARENLIKLKEANFYLPQRIADLDQELFKVEKANSELQLANSSLTTGLGKCQSGFNECVAACDDFKLALKNCEKQKKLLKRQSFWTKVGYFIGGLATGYGIEKGRQLLTGK